MRYTLWRTSPDACSIISKSTGEIKRNSFEYFRLYISLVDNTRIWHEIFDQVYTHTVKHIGFNFLMHSQLNGLSFRVKSWTRIVKDLAWIASTDVSIGHNWTVSKQKWFKSTIN